MENAFFMNEKKNNTNFAKQRFNVFGVAPLNASKYFKYLDKAIKSWCFF